MKEKSAAPQSGPHRRNPYRRPATVPEVISITNAAEAHSQEMHGRLVKYATAMGIRMVCIVLIFVFDGWFKLVPVVGAVLLPWVAVVIANGGADTNNMEATVLLDEAPPLELAANYADDGDGTETVLTGEFVVEEPQESTEGEETGVDHDPSSPNNREEKQA